MLTEAEKKWLEEREQFPSRGEEGGYFCKYCCHAIFAHGEFCCDTAPEEREEEDLGYCPTAYFREDSFSQVALFKDAAEFEARVAAKVAAMHWDCTRCPGDYVDDCSITDVSCTETRLKHARLAVEAEMEAESAGC